MKASLKRTMVIHFTDGSKKHCDFPAPVPDSDANLGTRLKEALDARHLLLEAEGALVVVPMESIKYLQVVPAPKKLPGHAIKGVIFKD